MGRHRHGDGDHRHGGDGPLYPVVAPQEAAGVAARVRHRHRRRLDRGRGGAPLLAVFVAGLFLFGSGQASNLLARYAATDLAKPEERGRAMSHVVFASTFGAVFGPLLIAHRTRRRGVVRLDRYTGPWLFASLCFLLAMINTAVRLRRTARRRRRRGDGRGATSPPIRHAAGVISAARGPAGAVVDGRLAGGDGRRDDDDPGAHEVARTRDDEPVRRLRAHRRDVRLQPAGRALRRPPRIVSTVQTGAAILVAATLLASAAGISEWLLFPALWALGSGWNFGLLGGSALLIESVASRARRRAGHADLTMSLCGAVAGFASGFIRRAVGYHVLADVAAAAPRAARRRLRVVASFHSTGSPRRSRAGWTTVAGLDSTRRRRRAEGQAEHPRHLG